MLLASQNNTNYLSCNSVCQKPQIVFSGLKYRCWQGSISFWRLQGRICFLSYLSWQNSVSCCCRTEIPITLSAGSCSLFLEATHIPWFVAFSSIFKASNSWLGPSHTLNLSCLFFCHISLIDFSAFLSHLQRSI